MKHRHFYFTLAILFIANLTLAQNKTTAFTSRNFYKPFISEISSTLNNLSLGKTDVHSFMDHACEYIVINEVHLGMDIPLVYGERNDFRWAVSAPVSIHMVWNPFEETTSPIINNDYRFGLSFTAYKTLNHHFIKNLSFKITPFAHESCHLGDEITIYALQNNPDFYRINVSYEYYELGLTLNDPELLDENTLSCRVGFMGLIHPKEGYYSLSENEIGNNTLYLSHRWAEYYLQLNYKQTQGFASNDKWHPNLSVEFRNRIQYNYQEDVKEERKWCINAYIGYDYTPAKDGATKTIGHYLRVYNGVNPHGQLREGTSRFLAYSALIYF